MTEIEFSALMVSRVCHDLVGPLGAVINGLEVLEDERDAGMREDALRLVTSSANQALARIQFMRIAFGAAGSAGAELDLNEVGRLVAGLLEGGKVRLEWNVPHTYWAKDWAKLLMNATILAADCLPRGGLVRVDAGADQAMPKFKIQASGLNARIIEDVERSLRGESQTGALDARGIQPFLTYRLSRTVNAGLTIAVHDGTVELAQADKPLFTFLIVILAGNGRIIAAGRYVFVARAGPRLAGSNLLMAHCLVVDDSRVIRTVARRLFEELHYTTSEAEDGMSALRACREKMPDMILLDWSMPGMTGVEFVRSLRAQPDGARPVILVCLTEVDANEIAHAVAAGIDDYIMKPFDRDILAAKLAELAAHRNAARPQSAAAGL